MDVRPIDANLFAKSLEIEARSVGVSWVCDRHEAAAIRGAFKMAATNARQFPTLDYAPVRHGEWIEDELEYPEEVVFRYKCSECGRTELVKEPYCHCGAKMDGGK